MRQWICAIAISASLALPGVVGQANALPVDRFMATAIPSDLEQAQFFFGGQNYCWYDDGWHGPGFYWCGYAFRRGLGWGGGAGWHGWQRGGPGRVGIGGRPGVRPGSADPVVEDLGEDILAAIEVVAAPGRWPRPSLTPISGPSASELGPLLRQGVVPATLTFGRARST